MNKTYFIMASLCFSCLAISYWSFFSYPTEKTDKVPVKNIQDSELEKILESFNESTSVEKLLDGLNHPNDMVWGKASKLLIQKGNESIPALLALLKSEKMEDASRIYRACYVLSHISQKDVAEIVLDENMKTTVRLQASNALLTLGVKASPSIPTLIKGLNTPDKIVQKRLIEVLGALVMLSPESVKHLIAACRSPSVRIQKGVVLALQNAGQIASPAVPTLIKMLGDKVSPTVQNEVLWTLVALRKKIPTIVDELIKEASTSTPILQENCITALGYMKESASPAIPCIAKGLEHPRSQVINSSQFALLRLSKVMKEKVLEELKKMASHPSEDVKILVQRLVYKIQTNKD